MAYDAVLAARLREMLADEPGLTERAMFGGLGFMLDGTMALAAGSAGDIMVRVEPQHGAQLIAEGRAAPMVMRGRALTGWLLVSTDQVSDDAALHEVVGWGVQRARSLSV